MFGYVIINQESLTAAQNARYQSAYCGLCHTLGNLHGLSGRFALSYDLTFLNLLLASLYEGESAETIQHTTCPIHPFQKRAWHTTRETAYCADMSIALHYYAAQDKWQDDKNILGFGFMHLFDQKRKQAETRYPAQCQAIRENLAKLAACEAANEQDLETVSDCFGTLMRALFSYKQDHWAEDLSAIGYYLGKYIYLLDAYDDLAKDKKTGAYNVLKSFSEGANYETELREILEDLIGRCTVLFERLPCVNDAEILRNILYSGVWLRYDCKAQQTEKRAKNN